MQRWLQHDAVTEGRGQALAPGFSLAMWLAVRGGPDGTPTILYAFGLSFLVWWIAIDLGWRIWRWVVRV